MPPITDPNWSPDAGYDPEKVPYVIVTIVVKDQETDEIIGQGAYDVDKSAFRHPDDWDEDTLLGTAGVDSDDYDAEKHYITWEIEEVNPDDDDE